MRCESKLHSVVILIYSTQYSSFTIEQIMSAHQHKEINFNTEVTTSKLPEHKGILTMSISTQDQKTGQTIWI
jgi:hypothetical protein